MTRARGRAGAQTAAGRGVVGSRAWASLRREKPANVDRRDGSVTSYKQPKEWRQLWAEGDVCTRGNVPRLPAHRCADADATEQSRRPGPRGQQGHLRVHHNARAGDDLVPTLG